MVWLKRSIIFLTILIVGLLAIGLVLPSDYHVERQVVIQAKPGDIYPSVVDLKAWPKWGVWFKRDPNMQVTYSGPDRAIGMASSWVSETQGSGEMEITDLKYNRKVTYRLYFPDFDMSSTGEVTLEDVEEGTLVTWSDAGDMGLNPVNRYMALMIDGMIGPDFEMGLENLKTVVENQQ
ncbi:SRPBCC family protein [Aestuariibacter sp. A3R04]|uniref:SRPBCC family protein n=1 Tax=Aestuariibacter sp. A3R04 TaxID=2841571 RepID=UPI001C08BDD3|nr:SRPBCC family protein [Aestuariibacter sp. A3R04]MBU3022677.1 SRPBCC family protein [Aestuariibacter sp. A3R04]